MRSLVGSFLVSRPESSDPNFDGTLTLVLEHDEAGALGVVVNRPSELTVAAVVPDWEDLTGAPGRIFRGGPVETNGLLGLGWSPDRPGSLALGIDSVDLDEQPALARAAGLTRLRIFAGYAGWAGGQLEGELANDAWWVVDAELDDVFTPDPENLWPRVLRRNGGEMAWFAHFPADPSLN